MQQFKRTMLKNIKSNQPFRLWIDEGSFFLRGRFDRSLKKYAVVPAIGLFDSTPTYFRGNFIVYVQE